MTTGKVGIPDGIRVFIVPEIEKVIPVIGVGHKETKPDSLILVQDILDIGYRRGLSYVVGANCLFLNRTDWLVSRGGNRAASCVA